MKLFAVLGNPIAHSKSPLLHNYVFYKLGISARYTRFLLESGENLKATFLALGLNGANITLPHKEVAFKACDEVRGIAREIEAVNTIALEDSRLIGYNTDAMGFYKNIENERITSALILGAGGSARAIACVLRENNIKVSVSNRSEKGLDFFKARDFRVCENLKNEKFDIIINATSSSIKGELPLPREILADLFSGAKIAFDLMYGRECAFLSLAESANLRCMDGAKMLLYQAIVANAIFLGKGEVWDSQIAGAMSEIYGVI